jgi:hypothetical protein
VGQESLFAGELQNSELMPQKFQLSHVKSHSSFYLEKKIKRKFFSAN